MPRGLLGIFAGTVLLPLACGGGQDGGSIATVFDPCRALVLVPAAAATGAEVAAVQAAAGFWNERAGSRLTLGDVPSAPSVPVEFQAAALSFHGLYDDQQGKVYVNRALSDDHQRAVVVSHEIGHAFGLVHVAPSARASVMNPDNLTVEPTDADVATLAARWGRCGG